MNETMNLHEYYRNHKDAINASIMDIACDLAVGRLLNAHDAPFETFVEADDPDDPDGGTHYKEEYQKEYDTYYDKEYARVAKLMKFDYCQDDGVAASPEDTNKKTKKILIYKNKCRILIFSKGHLQQIISYKIFYYFIKVNYKYIYS